MTIIRLSRDKGFDADKVVRRKVRATMRAMSRDLGEDFISTRVEIIEWDSFLQVAALTLGHERTFYTCRWSGAFLLRLLQESQPYSFCAQRLKISYTTMERIRSVLRKDTDKEASISVGLGLKLMELMEEEDLSYLVEHLINAYNINFNNYLYLDLRSDYV